MVAANGLNRQQIFSRLIESLGQSEYGDAEHWARQALEADANDAQALYGLAQAVYQQGRPAEAVELMSRLLDLDPLQPAFYNDHGVMLGALDNWVEAEAAYRMALTLDPVHVDARFNLALALFRQKRADDALDVLDTLEQQAPGFAEQFVLRGEILQSGKRYADAVTAYSKAIDLGLQRADVLVNLGTALSDAGNKESAFTLLAKAGNLESEDAATNFYLGNLFRDQGNQDEALRCFRKAVALYPEFAEAHNNLGLLLQAQGDAAGAEAAFQRALAVAPELGAVHANVGNARLRQGQMDLALACFRKAIELSPDSAEAWNNLGETLYCLQRLSEAEEAFRRALEIKPDCDEAELNLGILLLLRGDFEHGWLCYEKRWEMPVRRQHRPRFAQPEWAGECLDGKSLLIYVEQGMGDNLQFVRFLPVLREKYPDARLYYWGLRPLARLFSGLAERYGIELLPESIPGGVPPIDFHIALLSIPRCLGTRLETIPASVPYLEPSENLVSAWAKRMTGLKGKRVGLVWAGGEIYQFDVFRTLPLSELKPLFDVPGIDWVSLQKGAAAAQIAEVGGSGTISDWMSEVEDFADTAAIIANLDLVISVDTAVLHLAGAMGKPVWLLNRFNTDWRWQRTRSDSPWYPTLRVFRQAVFGDWGSVVGAVGEALTRFVAGDNAVLLAPAEACDATETEALLRLNLGCGNRKMPGFVNVDSTPTCGPDLVHDLEKMPWPWATGTVEEIKLIHVLEHLGQTSDVFLSIVKELYRVCRDGARIEIIVPHPRSDFYLWDPTHVRPVTVEMLGLFDKSLNREWAIQRAANTPLGIICDVDFEIESAAHMLEDYWQAKVSSGKLSQAELTQAIRQFNNVIRQSTIIWRVRKGR